jgi:hypothetical protein
MTLPNFMIALDGNAQEALHRQRYKGMRKAILTGEG